MSRSETDFFSNDLLSVKRARRPAPQMSLVAIIDMMTTIIFFLVLTTSFTAYTKHTLPPSGISTKVDASGPPPLQPMLLIAQKGENLVLEMSWKGANPGSQRDTVKILGQDQASRKILQERVVALVTSFTKKHPKEKTIQMGMTSETLYQSLINVMDGVQPLMPDIVLIDYNGVDARM